MLNFGGSIMIRRMLRFFILFSLLLTACSPSQSQLFTQTGVTVIGGREATDDDVAARSVVILHNAKTNELCGATLISDRHVITAAHCLVQEPESLRIIFGRDLHKRGLEERSVSAFRICPTFDPLKRQMPNCDVAILRFEGGIPNGYQTAALLQDVSRLIPEEHLTVVGVGMSDTSYWTGEGVLRLAQVPIAVAQFSPNEFLLNQRSGQGGCHGDSGGGIFLEVPGEAPILAGVVNRPYLDSRSKCNAFGVGLSIPMLYDWISSNLAAL